MAVARAQALELLGDFAAIFARFHALERVPRDFGCGELLFPAEIHTIAYVGSHPGCRPREVARELAVTRGRVSQMIGRLAGRGFLVRTESGEEPGAARLGLTSLGRKALAGHRELHRGLDERFLEHLGPVSAAEVARVRGITRAIIAELDAELGRTSLGPSTVP